MSCPHCTPPVWFTAKTWPDQPVSNTLKHAVMFLIGRGYLIARSTRDEMWRLGGMDGLDDADVIHVAANAGFHLTSIAPSTNPQVIADRIRRVVGT